MAMLIQDLFLKPVERPIDGVIKADDERHLRTELDEYVVTREIAKGLGTFTDRYLNELTANGVWISGFFGSGKSHLLKMLSYVLEDAPLDDGTRPSDLLLPKLEDEILRADLRKAAAIPSRSVLFNIDQKFDGIGGDHTAPILEVFVKVMNELQGYFGKQGYIAKFERDLDVRGELASFKESYLRVNGNSWEDDREAIATVRRAAFARAYSEHFGVPTESALGLLAQVREDYRVSIESFVEMVKEYIDRQPPGFRLNFFIDEVGQFIGQDSQRMLNLQTIAEHLGTVCEGRAWVFVTSQSDLERTLGDFRGMNAQDISKIQGRFKTRVTLASADVQEVIQKRLLAKHEPEPEALTSIYDREKENLQTLYRFGDQSVQLKGWRGSDEFCAFYPFHPYQFDLFQRAILQFSLHNAFTGRHMSVGERSMLEVFQDAVKGLRTQQIGRLAAFDALYDGISASIRGDMQTGIAMAHRQLGDGLEIRILKSLFLLKWVREFKATPRNVAILLIDRPDIDIRAHEKAVHAALTNLESQSYLQRNGDIYEFLTDVEKDIETEIKSTEIDESQVAKLLGDVLFADVLRDPKIRYEGNNQDYTYARKLDDHLVGRDADLAVNIITTDHPSHASADVLAAQNTGKAELLAILPADTRLYDQARLYLKTQKYIQQSASNGDTTRKSILDQRGQQNSTRRQELVELAKEFLGEAPLYLNGGRLESVGPGDARNRFAKACQELIAVAYPNLRMLKGSYSEATLVEALTAQDDLLSGGAYSPSEAEQEILTYVLRNQNNGERTAVDELVRTFGKRPYGWYPLATLTLLGRLFRMGKVELRTSELLDSASALEHLRNSRDHGKVRVRIQQQFDPARVNALKRFHQEFFDKANPGTDARSVGQHTADALTAEARALMQLLDDARHYPFLNALKPVTDRLIEISGRDNAYLLNHLEEFQDELLDAKEDLVAPIRAFMNGAQRTAYDEAIVFLRAEEANFAELPAEKVEPLRELAKAEAPFRGNVVPAARAAMIELRALLDASLAVERERVLAELAAHEARLQATPEFEALDDAGRAQVLYISQAARDAIDAARVVAAVRDRAQRYMNQEYSKQLELAANLAAQTAQPTPAGDGGEATPPAVTETGGATAPGIDTRGTSTVEPPHTVRIRYTHAGSLRAESNLPYISNEAELDEWLAALRKVALAELERGHRISL
jgi:hypothetical protein